MLSGRARRCARTGVRRSRLAFRCLLTFRCLWLLRRRLRLYHCRSTLPQCKTGLTPHAFRRFHRATHVVGIVRQFAKFLLNLLAAAGFLVAALTFTVTATARHFTERQDRFV